MSTVKGLYAKLGAIQAEVMGLQADKKGNGYSYLTGTKLLKAIKPLMVEYGLLLKPEVLDVVNTRMDYLVSMTQDKQTGKWNGKPKSEILTSAKLKFTWIDIETGDKDENLFHANGQNDWEKGLGSALTYGERYFIMKYFHLDTSEDDIDNADRKEKGRGALLEKVEKKFFNLTDEKKALTLKYYKVSSIPELDFDQLTQLNAKLV